MCVNIGNNGQGGFLPRSRFQNYTKEVNYEKKNQENFGWHYVSSNDRFLCCLLR